MSYFRVAPRDIFNEANFLKCIGQLALQVHDGMFVNLTFDEALYGSDGIEFDVNESNGDLMITECFFYVAGEPMPVYRDMNSREAWPVYVVDGDYEEIRVFNSEGKPSNEFLLFLLGAK